MASNQTEHYGLNQWEAEDPFVRTEFNEDNRKIDKALAEKTEQSDFLALTEVVALKGRLAIGTYAGNGAASRVISVGFTPKVVVLTEKSGQTQLSNMWNYCYGGISVTGHNAPGLEIVSNGFQVGVNESGKIFTNRAADGPYAYIALG